MEHRRYVNNWTQIHVVLNNGTRQTFLYFSSSAVMCITILDIEGESIENFEVIFFRSYHCHVSFELAMIKSPLTCQLWPTVFERSLSTFMV